MTKEKKGVLVVNLGTLRKWVKFAIQDSKDRYGSVQNKTTICIKMPISHHKDEDTIHGSLMSGMY